MGTRAEFKARLLVAAAAALRDWVPDGTPFIVKVEANGFRLEAESQGEWPEDTSAALERRGRWVSYLEQRVLDFLAGRPDVWSTGEEIAAALREQHQHKFKAILANMVEREIVECIQGRGYKPLPEGPLRAHPGSDED